MAVTYNPHTIKEYYQLRRRLDEVRLRYQEIEDPEEARKYHDEHWADLKATIEPPPINALILDEFMESHERLTAHIAAAFREFGKIPEGKERPQNAATLWKAMVHGFERVADRLTAPPEK